MISIFIYVLLVGLNILAYYKRTDKSRWFNLVVVAFMLLMAFRINWSEMPF